MKIYTIYKATNLINNKCYIGFDSNWPKRKIQHKRKHKHLNLKFYDAIKKYGWDNFSWEVLYQSLDCEHTLKYMESYFITEYNSFNNGYNMTIGGEGSLGYKHTPEQIMKNKIKNSGKNHYNYGKHLTEETKNKIGKGNSGKLNGMYGVTPNFTEQHRSRISKSLLGKPKSEEHKLKLKLAKQNSNYIMSEETRKKIGKNKCKPLILNNIKFNSVKEAAEYYNVHYTTIIRWRNKNESRTDYAKNINS